ncbi:MAG: glycosyltransferase [Flavobacteriales bacterium]|jgi:uncharacterized protein (TIGR00661 family)
MHFKVFLSDEGFGHIVRQRAVVEVLRESVPDLKLTLQTQTHSEAAGQYIPGATLIKRFNNIQWDKQPNGSPDLVKIAHRYERYIEQSNRFIEEERDNFKYDALLSDFVYEAFPLGKQMGVKTFGVAHFTWDWFFSKLYPPPVHTDVIRHFMSMADQATRLYFPPFTPEEIIHHYKGKALEVPLILHSKIDHKEVDEGGKFKVLIMDSGAGVLSESIRKALISVAELDDFLFFVSSKFETDQSNVRHIPQNALMVDYVANMDLVIGRAGFNTISECIGLRTPMLLIGEAMNPEMNENILMLKKQHLGSFISMQTFESGLGNYLPSFLNHEYNMIKSMMNQHEIASNGAEVIVNDMLNQL